jgi:O-acetyl-ADP-ribose deacetylase (regulator of RNase III)
MNLRSIAFPNISTGIYSFPKELAAKIAIEAVKESMKEFESIEEAIFCIFDPENLEIYQRILQET